MLCWGRLKRAVIRSVGADYCTCSDLIYDLCEGAEIKGYGYGDGNG